MASSTTVISCIQSALDDAAGLMKPPVPSGARALRFQLRNLKTFVLCSSKLVNDERQLGSLLLWIEDVVGRKAREISDGGNYSLEMESLEEEIQDWYITILDRSSSCDDHLMSNGEVLEVMSSILESLADIYDWRSSSLHFEMLGEAMEGLREQMAFLKCLLQMSDPARTSTDLMAHSQDVAINAAFLIFTCRGDEKRKGITFNISCLVQKIKPIDPWVCETYIHVLMSRPSSPTKGIYVMKSLLDSLIYNLWDILLELNTPHLAPGELQLQHLYEGLRSLKVAVVEQLIEEEDIGAAVCEAGVLICSLYQSHTDLDIQNLLDSINTICMGLTSCGDEPTSASGLQTKEAEVVDSTCNELGEAEAALKMPMVGRHDDMRSVCEQLYRESKRLQIISIVGMPGIGKTTLALRIFNDVLVSRHFWYRAWCPVTQVMDKRKVLLQLLHQIAHDKRFEETETEVDLANKLRRGLRGRKYLVFLDDVWSTEAWKSLRYSFPDDNNGSRIILTSRSGDVAPRGMLVDYQPFVVRFLSREESMELLHRRLFPEQQGWPPEFKDLAIQGIVDLCKGLPLVVVIVAGILASTEADRWKATLDCFISGELPSKLQSTFELSYRHLADHLKACFLYFAAFPKDGEVSVRRLLRLWIAEGLVKTPEDVAQSYLVKTPEDVAQSYLDRLVESSLIIVSKRRSDGGIKACRVHDLVHDFCTQKARDEKFFHSLNDCHELSAFSQQPDLRRLRIESNPEHFKESKLFCPRAASLLVNYSQQTKAVEAEEEFFLDISFLIRTFKLLHVLDIDTINIGHVFPSELGEVLVQLVFLAIRGEMRQIPSSIARLSKLETLIVDAGQEVVALPESLGSLFNLQFLYIKSSRSSGGATLPATKLENSRALEGLGTFYGAVVPSWGILGSLMRKYPNIRKLKCRRAKDDTENAYKSVVLEFLTQLDSLHLSSLNACLFKFRLPENLKKLTLSGFHMVPKKMSSIGKLPNLQVLKLLDASFEGNTWDMVEEEEFLKLEVLKLHSPSLVTWTTSADIPLYRLGKLTLDKCKSLKELPVVPLGDSTTIEVIEVYDCSSTVVGMVRDIVESQRDWGNMVKLIASDN